MTTRCNQAEVVFLRSEANRVSASIISSERSQFKNASVFSAGDDEGLDNRVERRCKTLVAQSMANVSRAGKNDGSNTNGRGTPDGLRSGFLCMR